MARGERLVVAAFAAAAALSACKRSSPGVPASAEAGAAPSSTVRSAVGDEAPQAAAAASDRGDFAPSGGHALVPGDYDAPTVTLAVGSETITTGTTGKPPPADPFEAATAAAKSQAVGCFAPLPAGDYSVSLSVVVSPGGRATRVSADSASVTDAAVIACVRSVGESYGWPSSANGRTLSLDVRVSGR
jgi:hypothetical protein